MPEGNYSEQPITFEKWIGLFHLTHVNSPDLSKSDLMLLLVTIKGVSFNNPSLILNFPLPLERGGMGGGDKYF